MRVLCLTATLGLLTIAACSGGSTTIPDSSDGGSGADGGPGNPPGCPMTVPAADGACSPSGLRCSYGCGKPLATCAGRPTNGAVWLISAGSACPPAPGPNQPCRSAADCRLFDDYCTGCDCVALSINQSDPVCSGPGVSCFGAPCGGRAAACVSGACASL